MQFSVREHQSYDTMSSSKESSRLKNKEPEVRNWLFGWVCGGGGGGGNILWYAIKRISNACQVGRYIDCQDDISYSYFQNRFLSIRHRNIQNA